MPWHRPRAIKEECHNCFKWSCCCSSTEGVLVRHRSTRWRGLSSTCNLLLVVTEARSGNVHWVPEHPCCLTLVKSPHLLLCEHSHTFPFVQNSPWGTVCFSHKHLHSLLTISICTEIKLIIMCYFTHISLLLVGSHLSKPRKEATA